MGHLGDLGVDDMITLNLKANGVDMDWIIWLRIWSPDWLAIVNTVLNSQNGHYLLEDSGPQLPLYNMVHSDILYGSSEGSVFSLK
jgi:hypothetical protein